jgi:MtN3 and saliva related transmembrane protein
MDIFKIIATVGGVLVILSAIPQVFTLIRHKSAKDISLPMFITLFTANILWLIYGLHLKDTPLIYTNGLAGLIALTNVILIIKYRYGQS